MTQDIFIGFAFFAMIFVGLIGATIAETWLTTPF